jgi:hypothetical protein
MMSLTLERQQMDLMGRMQRCVDLETNRGEDYEDACDGAALPLRATFGLRSWVAYC